MTAPADAIVRAPKKPDLAEARETIKYLRDEALNHYENVSNWWISEICEQVLEALREDPS